MKPKSRRKKVAKSRKVKSSRNKFLVTSVDVARLYAKLDRNK